MKHLISTERDGEVDQAVLAKLEAYARAEPPPPKEVSTLLGIPTAFFWAFASVCLGVVGSLWMFEGSFSSYFHWWHMVAGVCGLLAAIMAFRARGLWPLAAVALVVNLPTLLLIPLMMFVGPALH